LEQVSINVQIESESPIRAVYSPSHPVAISREEGAPVLVGYEARMFSQILILPSIIRLAKTRRFTFLPYRDPEELKRSCRLLFVVYWRQASNNQIGL